MSYASLLRHSKCCGCGAEFPELKGPTHRYMRSSPACWAAFGQVLAREYTDRRLDSVHRLTVDSYAVQHPGERSAQTIQSVAVHLCRLCMIFEGRFPIDRANDLILAVKQFDDRFRWLEPPSTLGAVTIADVLSSKGTEEHNALVHEWARAAWSAWSIHHETVRSWLALRFDLSQKA